MQSTKPIEPRKRATKIDYSNGHTANSNGLTQAYILREIAAEQALELRSEPAEDLQAKVLRARAIKDLVCVWQIASDRIRILRGKPLPGSLRPEKKPTRKKQISTAPAEQPDPPAS